SNAYARFIEYAEGQYWYCRRPRPEQLVFMMQEKKVSRNKIILILGLVVLIAGLIIGFVLYKRILAPNVTDKQEYLYIPTGSGFDDLMDNLSRNEIVIDTASFRWVAEQKEFTGRVKAGKYKMSEGMNNRALVNLLAAGIQEPVQLRFQNFRLK